MDDVVVKLVETEAELEGAINVRMRVFVVEQQIPPEEELDEELSRYNREFFEAINPEDYQATWRLQRTIGSRYAEAGPLSVKEACLFYFQRYLARRLSNI